MFGFAVSENPIQSNPLNEWVLIDSPPKDNKWIIVNFPEEEVNAWKYIREFIMNDSDLSAYSKGNLAIKIQRALLEGPAETLMTKAQAKQLFDRCLEQEKQIAHKKTMEAHQRINHCILSRVENFLKKLGYRKPTESPCLILPPREFKNQLLRKLEYMANARQWNLAILQQIKESLGSLEN